MALAMELNSEAIKTQIDDIGVVVRIIASTITSGQLGDGSEKETDPLNNTRIAELTIQANEIADTIRSELDNEEADFWFVFPEKLAEYQAQINQATDKLKESLSLCGERGRIQLIKAIKDEVSSIFNDDDDLSSEFNSYVKTGKLLNGIQSLAADLGYIMSLTPAHFSEVTELILSSIASFDLLDSETSKNLPLIGKIFETIFESKHSDERAHQVASNALTRVEEGILNISENLLNGDLELSRGKVLSFLDMLSNKTGETDVYGAFNALDEYTAHDRAFAALGVLAVAQRVGLINGVADKSFIQKQARVLKNNPDFGYLTLNALEESSLLQQLSALRKGAASDIIQPAEMTSAHQQSESHKSFLANIKRLDTELTKLLSDDQPSAKDAVDLVRDILARAQSGRKLVQSEFEVVSSFNQILSQWHESPNESTSSLFNRLNTAAMTKALPSLWVRDYEAKGLNAVPIIRIKIKSIEEDTHLSYLKLAGAVSFGSIKRFTDFPIEQSSSINKPGMKTLERTKFVISKAVSAATGDLQNRARTHSQRILAIWKAKPDPQYFHESVMHITNDKKRTFNAFVGICLEAARDGLINTKMEDVRRILIHCHSGGLTDAKAEAGLKTLTDSLRVDSELMAAVSYEIHGQKDAERAQERGYESDPMRYGCRQ